MRHVWTPNEDARLDALLASGLNQREAAARIGISFNSVRKRLHYRRAGTSSLYSKGRVCTGCPKPLTNDAKGELCRSCCVKAMNADDDFQRARLAGVARVWRDPNHRAKMARVCAEISRKSLLVPGRREELRKWGRKSAREVLMRPDIRAKTLSPEVVAKRAKTQSENLMAWCPPEYRDEYRWLTKTKQIRAPQARAIIAAQIAKAEAALTPFERQMRALERGAKLVANDAGPRFGEAVDCGEDKWAYGRVSG